ncbi:MAG: twin-arginine translocase TatA/TatE family subunit [Candidatus Amulumruptor caecigallinarius]|nr:twin-arginine translocase TatA/TatE family subunit [Candidatus Amulumruptor caecigallinarius]MCM1395995.1 twin-arginine translocase TatA/TatE family subunit [Candidatus Amulumruptor caecigallinarius]MCM1454569.1 twin-arginine translocase TatA/TatE family subunit [bacterium]
MIPCFFNIGTGEVVLLVIVVLLLFGGRKIPELMKGLGKGVRSFRDGLNDATAEAASSDKDAPRPGKDA